MKLIVTRFFQFNKPYAKYAMGTVRADWRYRRVLLLMDHADGRQASLFRLIPVRAGISGWGCRQADVQRRGLAQQCCEEVTKRIANTNHSQL
jgi:hypothetical protein